MVQKPFKSYFGMTIRLVCLPPSHFIQLPLDITYPVLDASLHDDTAPAGARVADHVAGVAAEPWHGAGTGWQAQRIELHRHVDLALRQRVQAVVIRRRQAALNRTAVRSYLRSLLFQICESSWNTGYWLLSHRARYTLYETLQWDKHSYYM